MSITLMDEYYNKFNTSLDYKCLTKNSKSLHEKAYNSNYKQYRRLEVISKRKCNTLDLLTSVVEFTKDRTRDLSLYTESIAYTLESKSLSLKCHKETLIGKSFRQAITKNNITYKWEKIGL